VEVDLTSWRVAREEIDLDVHYGLRVGVNENHSVNVECCAVLQKLSSRWTVRQSRSEASRFHLRDVASAVTCDQIISAQTERQRLTIGAHRPRTRNLPLEHCVPSTPKESEGAVLAVSGAKASRVRGDLAILLACRSGVVRPRDLLLAPQAPRLNDDDDGRREQEEE